MFRRSSILVIFILAALISGCAARSGLETDNVRPGKPVDIGKGEALVFGRIIINEEGRRQVPFGLLDEPYLTVYHLGLESKSRGLTTESDGWFFWTVTSGAYYMPYITYKGHTLKPKAAFEAPEEFGVYYIGELVVDYRLVTTLRGLVYASQTGTRVEERFDEARTVVRERFPGFDRLVEKRVLVHDDEFPKDPLIPTTSELLPVLTKHGIGLKPAP